MEFPRLETARLLLRQFALSDAADVQRLAGDRAIADTTLMIPHPYEDGMAEQWIGTHAPKFEAGEQMTLAITLGESGHLVGAVSLSIDARFDRAELGYWVGKPHWGGGATAPRLRGPSWTGVSGSSGSTACSPRISNAIPRQAG